MGRASYRLLRVLKEAGIKYDCRYRPHLVEFLEAGFKSEEGRREWLRRAVFAVNAREVDNPGAYIKRLAECHIHTVLVPGEEGSYEEACERGFGDAHWKPIGPREFPASGSGGRT